MTGRQARDGLEWIWNILKVPWRESQGRSPASGRTSERSAVRSTHLEKGVPSKCSSIYQEQAMQFYISLLSRF